MGLKSSARGSAVKGKFRVGLVKALGNTALTPNSFAQNQFWLDPYDTSTMTFRTVAEGTLSTYFSRATTGAGDVFNFQGDGVTSKFWFSQWFLAEDWNNVTGFLGKFTGSDGHNGCYIVRNQGSGNNLRFDWDIYTAASTFVAATYLVSGGIPVSQWNHLCGVYDGSQHGTDSAVAVLYLNNVKLTQSGLSGTQLPQLLQNPSTGQFAVNTNFLASSANMRFADVTVGAGVLTPTQIGQLWNGGFGQQYAGTVAIATPTAYWAMNEASGTRFDSTSNHLNLSENGGTIGSINQVIEWRDKSSNGFKMQAADGATINISYDGKYQQLRIREPRYYASYGTWGTPAVVQEFGNNGLYTLAPSYCGTNTTGQMFMISGETALGSAETYNFWTGNDNVEVQHHELWMHGMYGTSNSDGVGYTPVLRISNGLTSDDWGSFLNIAGNTGSFTAIPGNAYYTNDGTKAHRMYGIVGSTPCVGATAGSWEMYIENAPQIVNGAFNGIPRIGWLAALTAAPISAIALGAFYRWTTDDGGIYNRNQTPGGPVAWGDTMVFSPCLTPSQEAAMRAWMQKR